jgi:DNA-3-methyladenine glycosylase
VSIVERDFYRRDPREVAPELLNKLLVRRGTAGDGADAAERVGRIVKVEAYCGGIDPGSHAYRGLTPRNRTMFGPPGGLYVYFTYGMHWCANAVCGEEGEGVAVLLRALAPVAGLDAMRAVRPRARRDRDLCSGPAKLCQALGLGRAFDGADLVTGDRGVVVCDDGTPPPADPVQTTRIGLSAGAEHPWRWYVRGDPNVSRPRAPRGGIAEAAGSTPPGISGQARRSGLCT